MEMIFLNGSWIMTEHIKARRSVRTFDGQSLGEEVKELTEY